MVDSQHDRISKFLEDPRRTVAVDEVKRLLTAIGYTYYRRGLHHVFVRDDPKQVLVLPDPGKQYLDQPALTRVRDSLVEVLRDKQTNAT